MRNGALNKTIWLLENLNREHAPEAQGFTNYVPYERQSLIINLTQKNMQ